ncbi:MAG: complex I subunit 1/NuoH family protein [Myxococcaceae bacterium]
MSRTLKILFVILLLVPGLLFALGWVQYRLGGWLQGGCSLFGGQLCDTPGTSLAWLSALLIHVLLVVMVLATLLTVAERKWSAFTQDRIGPERARVGPAWMRKYSFGGVPHVAADALKMIFKEDTRPKAADSDRVLFWLGPVLAFAPVFALAAVIPFGPTVLVNGYAISAQVADPNFGLLYVLAIASLAVYGTALAGWASNSKFALLGGVRAASQMVSYEVALGLSLVGMMVAFSTVQLPVLVGSAAKGTGQAQYLWEGSVGGLDFGLPAWGIFLQPVGFLLFFAAAFAETKRAPFDVPEGESEIIGYFLEYSGMKFGTFMISEFIEVVVLSALIAAIFLGGWHFGFAGDVALAQGLGTSHPVLYGALGSTVFALKVVFLCWFQLIVRWTFPRFRYDQIMTLGWKILLPLGLTNLFVSAALVLLDPSLHWLAVAGLLEIAVLVGLTLTSKAKKPGPASAPAHSLPAAAASAHH